MNTIKGILSFPSLFTPKAAQGATDKKYSCSILLPPTDPQVQPLLNAVEQAKRDAFPSGYTGADECFTPYDVKYAGKPYYDARFSGWYVFSCTAREDDKPPVVDQSHNPIVNPADVYPGAVVYVAAGISGYTKGKGGVGGWLNGVMLTTEEPPMGRLDSKPTVDQMFAGVGSTPMAPAPAPAPAPAVYQMTAAAQGFTREQWHQQGWSDEQLISQGLMLPPNGVTPSFT